MECRIYFFLGLIPLCTAGIFYANLIMKRADIVKFSKGLYSAPSSFMYPAVSNFEKKKFKKSPKPITAFSQVQHDLGATPRTCTPMSHC